MKVDRVREPSDWDAFGHTPEPERLLGGEQTLDEPVEVLDVAAKHDRGDIAVNRDAAAL